MRLFPPPLDIGDNEGFVATKDIFGRANLGRGLTNLVSSVVDPMVVAIDGQWGSGKTTFLKMWAGELRKSGFPVVYFDAFENDYVEDAFTAIASEIISLAEEKRKANTRIAKQFVKKAIDVGKVLLRSGLKIGVKAATIGALDATDFENAANEIAGEAENLTDKYLGEFLTKQRQQKDAIQGFRDALVELPALLTEQPAEAEANANAKPLIFIIDELDRCRPHFALEVLERIKHFFSVQNVHFVLGTHLDQLNNSVIVAYGPNIDARTYLQKFIQLTFTLVDSAQHEHERIITKYVAYLVKAMEFKPDDHETVEYATRIIRYVSERRDLSLRAVERIMSVLAIALSYTPRNYFRPPPILGGLCVLKVTAPELFVKAKRGTLEFAEVQSALALDAKVEEREQGTVEFYTKWWRFCTDLAPEQELIQELRSALFQYSIERQQIVPILANDIIDRLVSR